MGLKLAFQSLELKGSIQPLQTILTSLRKAGKGSLLCAECDSKGVIEGVENLSTRIEQISDALTTLSRALEEEARTGLLRRSKKLLREPLKRSMAYHFQKSKQAGQLVQRL